MVKISRISIKVRFFKIQSSFKQWNLRLQFIEPLSIGLVTYLKGVRINILIYQVKIN